MGLILSLLKDVQSKNFAAAARDNDKHKLGAPAQTMDYYHHVRREIAPLLPSAASRILEVGAGAGGTLKWLKDTYPNAETTAVELNGALRDELQRNADVVLIGSIEETFPLLKKYDLILLLDVLEHLPDSTGTLQQLAKLLVPGGHVIVEDPVIPAMETLLQAREKWEATKLHLLRMEYLEGWSEWGQRQVPLGRLLLQKRA